MRSSWNFSTAIFEIWVLVLTKPGRANETPTTSLKVPKDYDYDSYRHHHVQHQHYYQHHHHHHSHHHQHHPPIPFPGSIISSPEDLNDRDNSGASTTTTKNNHFLHSSHYHYSNSNNNRQHQHHYLPHHHHHHYYNHNEGDGGNNNNNPHLEDSETVEEPLALASSSYYSSHFNHRCYVCLPPNKNSREAQQILDIFAKELRPLIPDCKDFDPYVDAGRYEFECPRRYGGCLLRIHGNNVSRACSKYTWNGCKKANSVEFCYCTTSLCNDKKPEPPIIPPAVVQHVGEMNSRRRENGNPNGGRKSSLRGRTTGDEEVGNSQGIRSRVPSSSSLDEDDILHIDDEDEDNGGSGAGLDQVIHQHQDVERDDLDHDDHDHHHHQNIHSFIDPSFTSTIDPSLFHEENGAVVDVEDPNPHTKIGISMTASTGGASSGGSSRFRISGTRFSLLNFVVGGGVGMSSGSSVFHLFLYLLQRTLLLDHGGGSSGKMLFQEEGQVVLVDSSAFQLEPLRQKRWIPIQQTENLLVQQTQVGGGGNQSKSDMLSIASSSPIFGTCGKPQPNDSASSSSSTTTSSSSMESCGGSASDPHHLVYSEEEEEVDDATSSRSYSPDSCFIISLLVVAQALLLR